MTPRLARLLVCLVAAAGLVWLSALSRPEAAAAIPEQETLLADNGALLVDPAGTMHRLRLLGVERVRVFLAWNSVAPAPGSRHRPRHFDAADPGAYPSAAWAPWDAIVRAAAVNGIGIDLDLAGGAPLWATPPGAPRNGPQSYWQPSPKEYGAFVRAAGIRYGGAYDPAARRVDPENALDLPAVRFWSVWNEPNYGPSLAPQGLPAHLRVEHSPAVYRALVDSAWSALHATGHGGDTFLWGELAPRGASYWGVYSGIKPLRFLRALYCVDSHYHPLRGLSATQRGCPARPLRGRAFRAAHPALFAASGVSVHPYMRWYPPNHDASNDPDYASLGAIGNLETGLDRLVRVWGSRRRFPIYNTEFGYLTSPPKRRSTRNPWVSPDVAADYMNWAEYLSWRSPRLASFDQYLLFDPVQASASNDYGGYASGLLTYSGQQKLTYLAFRLPLYLPSTRQPQDRSLEVWGCVRPAHFAEADTGTTQTVEIQFAPQGSSTFITLEKFPVSDPRGYFDTRVAFPSSGQVRLLYIYPPLDPALAPGYPVLSRTVSVTVEAPR